MGEFGPGRSSSRISAPVARPLACPRSSAEFAEPRRFAAPASAAYSRCYQAGSRPSARRARRPARRAASCAPRVPPTLDACAACRAVRRCSTARNSASLALAAEQHQQPWAGSASALAVVPAVGRRGRPRWPGCWPGEGVPAARRGRPAAPFAVDQVSIVAVATGKEWGIRQPGHDRVAEPGAKLSGGSNGLVTRSSKCRARRGQQRQQSGVRVRRPLHEEAGQRPGRDVALVVGAGTTRAAKRRGAERLVGRRRRVDYALVGQLPGHLVIRVGRDRPKRTDQDALARSSAAGRSASSAGTEPRRSAAQQSGQAPGNAILGDHGKHAIVHRGEQPGLVLDGDLHTGEGGEREQQRRPGLGEQPGDQRDGALVTQRQLDHGLEAVGQA